MSATEVLPVGRRPKCRDCGDELRPNYDTRTTGKHTARKYKIKKIDYSLGPYEHREIVRAVTEDDHGAQQAVDGRWYVEHTVDEKERTFKGTYGRYQDGLFCGLTCAYRWAVRTCRAVEAHGKRKE